MSSKTAYLFCALLSVAMLHCATSPTQLTGGASGTEVSSYCIVGAIVDSTGTAVNGAVVRLRPSSFLYDSLSDPSYTQRRSVLDSYSASNGLYRLEGVHPDTYQIEILHDDSTATLLALRTGGPDPVITLPADTLRPMALIEGAVRVYRSPDSPDSAYLDNAHGKLQVFGLHRRVLPDSDGRFRILVPRGNHTIHIGAIDSDTAKTGEFDAMNVTLDLHHGEHRDIGNINLFRPQQQSCNDGTCDSLTVRRFLDEVHLNTVHVDSVTLRSAGRIVELRLSNLPVGRSMPFGLTLLSRLQRVYLERTGIEMLWPDIDRLADLQIIMAHDNHIKKVPDAIGRLTQLDTLDLAHNDLTGLPAAITGLTTISSLDLSGNMLTIPDTQTAAWADRHDPDWRSTQRSF